MGGGFDVGYWFALWAGVLSFLSPCVLPLVPPYLCFLGGLSMDELQRGGVADGAPRRVVYAAAAFVLGFITVFVLLGASASMLGRLVASHLDTLSRVAGVLIILLGLHFLGVLRIPLLYREVRYHAEARPTGLVGAYVVGLAFAFGWTPCVGPVLATILMLAASEESAWRGAGLLSVYGLGIGIPFLLAALLVGPFLRFMRRFRRHVGAVERIMGVLLVVTGILFITGSMNAIGFWLQQRFDVFQGLG